MTTSATELEAVEQDMDDSLWHIRRDHSSRSFPWVALCGAVRTVDRGSRRAWELSIMEKCRVCTDLLIARNRP